MDQCWLQIYFMANYTKVTQSFLLDGVTVTTESGVDSITDGQYVIAELCTIECRGLEGSLIEIFDIAGVKIVSLKAASDREVISLPKSIYIVKTPNIHKKVVVS